MRRRLQQILIRLLRRRFLAILSAAVPARFAPLRVCWLLVRLFATPWLRARLLSLLLRVDPLLLLYLTLALQRLLTLFRRLFVPQLR